MKEVCHSQAFTQETSDSPETMGWALQWEGVALSNIEARLPRNGNGRAHGAVRWEQLEKTVATAEWPNNGSGPTSFPQPQAWALQWHGPALLQGIRGDGCSA